MKYLLTILLAAFISDPANIGKINALKKEARHAFLSGDYEVAISKYKTLVDSLEVTDEEVKLNLTNAYFKANDTTASLQGYQNLMDSKNKSIASRAFQQLGVMDNREGKFEQALTNFKQAIKADPTNDEARYNYEMLKKKLDEKKKQEEKDKDKDKDKKDQKDQEKQDQEKKDEEKKDQEKKDQEQKDQEKKDQEKKDQEKKDQEKKEEKSDEQKQEEKDQQEKEEKQNMPPDLEKKLKDMKITPEKAQMILEAMKNQEIQYLQQNKRKATKPKDKSKPDW